MHSDTKTDNSHLEAKLVLRRHFLDEYHAGRRPVRVFDACQGSGVIWGRLREEYDCSYWGVDVKKQRGRLSIDSKRVLQQPGWDFDVIDVDTYGSPWGHWEALLPNVRAPVTVFLTVGLIRAGGGGNVGTALLRAAGLRFKRLRLPIGLGAAVSAGLLKRALGLCYSHGLEPAYTAEVLCGPATARYVGVRLCPERRRKRA